MNVNKMNVDELRKELTHYQTTVNSTIVDLTAQLALINALTGSENAATLAALCASIGTSLQTFITATTGTSSEYW